jgi:transposase InsO family protein
VGELLEEFPDVVNSGKVLPHCVVHDVEHFIKTSGPPIASKFRRLEGDKLEAARREFAIMEEEGIIRRSTSPWASPLHMVPKKDGSWRPCGDFRRLNLVTEADVYPLPNMLDFADRLHGCTVFSKIDLRKGYWQVPVAAEDIKKTAISTPFGLFEFLRMPFGLRNAGSSFQRMMDRVLTGLPFAYCYLDDLRIASPDRATHFSHLRQVFGRLRDFGLVISLEKCDFCVDSFEFLGHQVSALGARPVHSYVEAVKERRPPTTVRELQVFLGLVNFYRRFIPGVARDLLPLTDALKGNKPASEKLDWSPALQAAFERAKAALSEATWLAHPHPKARLALHVDASASHVGAALHQQVPGRDDWQPLGFFSRKLNTAQVKWSAFDRELLACVASIRHFRFILEGRAFSILTDHKPLLGALTRTTDPWTARQCRHLAYVAEFTSDVRHVAGEMNVAADALSRPPGPVAAVHQEDQLAGVVLDLRAIASRQAQCASTQQTAMQSSLRVRACNVEGVKLLCDLSTGRMRPLVPAEDRKQVFNAIHGVAHPGVRATRRLLRARFVWSGMNADVAAWCADCTACQRAKVAKQHTSTVEPIAIPQRRFSHVHVDIVGPLPVAACGATYLLTMIDRSTRWLEAVPMRDMTAATCTSLFISTWVARYGVPSTLTSDRGTQFSSEIWRALCEKMGIRHVMTTSYHPQANGLVERAHRQLKDALRARGAGTDWPVHLPLVLLGLRAAPKEISGFSSAEAVFGQPLVLPGELKEVKEEEPLGFQRRLASDDPPPTVQPRTYAEVASSRLQPGLQEAKFVYVKRGGSSPPLASAYLGPYRVLQPGLKFFVLEVGGKEEKVTVDRLKIHRGTVLPQVAVPVKRGRPLKNSASPV